ncbi:MAG: PAS domain-containing protein [Lautropia sp.]
MIEALRAENAELRRRLDLAEQAIRGVPAGAGARDAPASSGVDADDPPMRLFVDRMQQGAATLRPDGTIAFCNRQLEALLGLPPGRLVGARFATFVAADDREAFDLLCRQVGSGASQRALRLRRDDGVLVATRLTLDACAQAGEPTTILLATGLPAHEHAEEARPVAKGTRVGGHAHGDLGLPPSEARLQAVVSNLPGGAAFVVDRDLRYLLARGEALSDLGMKPSDFEGRTVFDALDPDTAADYSARYRRTLEGEPFTYEHEIAGRVFESRGVPLRSAAGDIYGVLAFSVDVTARKHAENALRVAGDSFRQLVEQSPFGVYAVDADFRLAMVSAGARRIFANVQPLLGRNFDDVLRILWPEPFVGEALGRFRHTLATGEPYHAPSTVETRADIEATESYDWKIERVILPDGRPGVICHFYDLSERQRYEESLRVARARLETALAASQIVLFHQDRDLRYTWIHNPQLGFTVDDVVGRRGDELFPHAGAMAEVESVKRRAMQTGLPQREEVCVPHEGRHHYYDLLVQPDRDTDGRITGVNCAALEITGRKEVEAQLREADRRKDEFLATLAHELRNPLAPIRAGLEVMKRAGADRETIERSRAMLERQVAQMTRLIDDLMDISRIAGGRIVLQKSRMALADAVRDAVDAARPLVDARAQSLVVDLPAEAIDIDGDLARLSQVFANLLNNAAKYTEPGGRIRLDVERQGEVAIVRVHDTGIGIPADALTRIFDMFAQVDGALDKAQGGLGIGLNLAKRLIEKHGGSIEAKSEGPGRGSTFVVHLPVIARSPDADIDAAVDAAPPDARRRVLVVDDNRDAADSLGMLLELAGHVAQVAYDARQGLELAERLRPDVVLLDIGLPGLDGHDACRRLRACPWGERIKVIAVTGWGQDDDRRRSRDAGFDHHLIKPIDPGALLKLIGS